MGAAALTAYGPGFVPCARPVKWSWPCYTEDQPVIARLLNKYDRGKFVRDEGAYLELAGSVFGHVTSDIRDDMLNLPYSTCILKCGARS